MMRLHKPIKNTNTRKAVSLAMAPVFLFAPMSCKNYRAEKAEVKKAIFFSKHPELLMAKKEVEAVKAEKSVHAFNEVVAKDVQQAVAEAPKKEVKEPQPEPVKPMELSRPAPQHVKTPLKVGLGKWWL